MGGRSALLLDGLGRRKALRAARQFATITPAIRRWW
jgi:hypothetical protein